MRKRFNKAIATLTLMMMILTLVMPVGAFAAPPADNPVYTFTESEANDGSFTEQFQVELGKSKGLLSTYDNKYTRCEIVDGSLPEGLKLGITTTNDDNVVNIRLVDKAKKHNYEDSASIKIKFYYSYGFVHTGSLDKTFNIIFRDNVQVPDDDSGQAEILERDKIRVLEIYPNSIRNESERVNEMDVISRLRNDSDFEVTTISINRLISLKDDINGKYDVVYFNGGEYTRNYAYEHSYGSDITYLCAEKLIEYIESGQLCIFHTDVFSKNGTIYDTILKEKFRSYADNADYKNVIVVNNGDKNNVIRNLKSLYQDIAQGMNPRPVLEIIDAPATYSADNTDPVSNRLTFSFKVYDPNTPMDDTLKVALYLDRNNDSLYDEKEIVFYQGAEGDRYTMEVKNGRSGTITYDMPQGLTGVYFWKLVVKDAQNAKTEYESVFRLKGNEITVRLLQIKPDYNRSVNSESDGKGNLSLKKKFDQRVDGQQYRRRVGEYEIIVDEITVQEFNRRAARDEIRLNGVYDMVVIGFNDNYTEAKDMNQDYSGALGPKAVELLEGFINTKQSVMFTHDTIHFTYNRDLTEKFGEAVGQVFQTDREGRFAGIWTAGLAGSDLSVFQSDVNPGNREEAERNINTYDPHKHYQTINTWPDLAQTVKPVNSSAVTLYPFILEGGEYQNPNAMRVASTHYQWYKLNLEDPEVIPLFNLYKEGKDKFNDDAMNNYYTYTKGTITYSGTGHKTDDNEKYPEFETKLFVNTAIKAYSIANHAPEVTILEPQDNEKVSRAEETLTLRFRAYDFDFSNDYLFYEVFIDAENGGGEDDFESLTDGNKIRMRNGEQIVMDITEDKLPDIGKFRLKVYAEDEFGAFSYEIITLERVDTPMITPGIEICDLDGNPISGALVNQEVKALLSFAVTGKTEIETTCTPVFDLKGAYYTETEKDYLTNESLGEVVFSNGDPDPKEIDRDYQFPINPESPGDTELRMTVTVRKVDELFDEKSSADSIAVRSGQVDFYVRDKDGNPIRNAPIRDEDTDTILGMTDGAGYLHVDGLVGEKSFTLGALAGYTYNGVKKISRMDESGTLHEETDVNLTYENNRWRVEFEVDYSLGLTIDYYKLNLSRTALSNVGSAGTIHEVKNHKFTPATIVAVVRVEPLASGELRKIDFKIETSDGVNLIEDARFKAVISDGPDSDIATLTGYSQLKASNSRGSGSYADNTYFLVIEVPRTDEQIVKIPEVKLTTETHTGSKIERTLTFSGGVKFVETTPPMLR